MEQGSILFGITSDNEDTMLRIAENKARLQHQVLPTKNNGVNRFNEDIHSQVGTQGYDNRSCEIIESGNQKIMVVAPKKGGIEGGAVIDVGGKRYMAKGLYKKKNKKGEYFYKPYVKNIIKKNFFKKTKEEINKSVISEYVAFQLASVLNPEIVTPCKLGIVTEDDNSSRLFLLTEMAGQNGDGKFSLLKDEQSIVPQNSIITEAEDDNAILISSSPEQERMNAMLASSYAISVGLLNDQDINKTDNIGILARSEVDKNPVLFDLGHPAPDKFELDEKTLLPKAKSVLQLILQTLINFLGAPFGIHINNLPDTFTFEEKIESAIPLNLRKQGLQQIVDKKDAILAKFGDIRDAILKDNTIPDKSEITNLLNDLETSFGDRINYVERILIQHKTR